MIDKKRLRELAALRPDGHKVLSLYVNLDPSEFPTPRARSTEIHSLLDSLDRSAKQYETDHAHKMELRGDLEKLRDYFDSGFDAKDTLGVAVFACGGIDLFEVHHLERPIGSEAVIDDSPFIEPLTTMPGTNGYCVLLINRQVARVFTGGAERMREIAVVVDDLRNLPDHGGRTEEHYQRGIAKEAQDHLKRSGEEMLKLFKQGLVQRLVIGAPQEIRNEVEQKLHSYLRDRIAGWIDIDVVYSTPKEVADHAGSVIVDDQKRIETEWLERLQAEVARKEKGVAGLSGTLAALNEKRVETLLLCSGYRPSGFATPNADYLSTEDGSSPSGQEPSAVDDVIEPALESALEQSSEIVVVRHHAEQLESMGSIGAVLRF